MQRLLEAPNWVIVVEAALIIAFFLFSFCVPRGVLRRSSVQNPLPKFQAAVRGIGEKARDFELDTIATTILPFLGESKGSKNLAKEHFATKIFTAIDYAIRRHDWYEDQRSRMLQVTLAITTAVLAIIAIVAQSHTALAPSQKLVLLALGILSLASVVIQILFYNAEFDTDRPYRLISDIRFWYWRYNLPDPGLSDDPSKSIELAEKVAAERLSFVKRASENVAWEASVREDLEQLFILHCLQRYRAESLAKMRWAVSYLTIICTAHLLLFIVATWSANGAH